ncbi:hypothetical protein DFJ77DRAFT_479614 [Powellomyces hirtus]|nr:hypothetical protein DFJ77DRAFT_479614 [Powellomyces hirtus]
MAYVFGSSALIMLGHGSDSSVSWMNRRPRRYSWQDPSPTPQPVPAHNTNTPQQQQQQQQPSRSCQQRHTLRTRLTNLFRSMRRSGRRTAPHITTSTSTSPSDSGRTAGTSSPYMNSQGAYSTSTTHLPASPFRGSRLMLHVLVSTSTLPAYRSTVTLHLPHCPPIYTQKLATNTKNKKRHPWKWGRRKQQQLEPTTTRDAHPRDPAQQSRTPTWWRTMAAAASAMGDGLSGHAMATTPAWGAY